MGEPAAFLTLNGTNRQSQAPGPRPGEARTSAQQFWTEFWTERLQALKRYLESTQGSKSEPAPSAAPDTEDSG